MTLKFAQITASVANFTTIDALLGVQSLTSGGGNDRLFSPAQLASAILTSPNITGHATIEGVTLSGATGTGSIVLDHLPTIGTATLNSPTLNTAILNSVTINTATIARATINTATINNATLNTSTLNTATLVSPTLTNAVLNAPVINNGALATATINTATINNAAINTATIANVTISTGTLNNVTLNTAVINSSTLGTATLNSPTLNTAIINTATINNATLNTAVIGTSTINNSTLGTATLNSPTLNTATINTGTLNNVLVNPAAATTGFSLKSNGTLLAPSWAGGMVLLNTLTANQLGSWVDTTSLTSTYSRYCLAFENVCPVSTATLTCSLNMLVATTGVAWISANYISNIQVNVGVTAVLSGTTSLFLLSGLLATTSVGTSPLYGVNGVVELINPANAVFRKSINGKVNYLTPAAGQGASAFPAGFWDGGTNAITGINVAFQTGNIATGTLRIYGVI